MGVDVGKEAKRAGRERPRDARKRDQDLARVPPHKKLRTYTLTVEWREEQVLRRTQSFTSKDARDQARIRWEREIREKKWLSWAGWKDERTFRVKEGPTFSEQQSAPQEKP